MAQQHLVFDLDDTLYPERAYAIGGFKAAGAYIERQFGVVGLADRLIAHLDEGHLGQSFKLALDALVPQHTEAELKAVLKAYGDHVPDLRLFDDAAALLAIVAGQSLGLITDGHARTQQRKVAALGIATQFSEIIYTGALGPDRAFHKPHPRAFELMETALRRSPSDTFVYVGDNPTKDFLAPNTMGWRTIMVDRPDQRRTRIHPLKPAPDGGAAHMTIATLDALMTALD